MAQKNGFKEETLADFSADPVSPESDREIDKAYWRGLDTGNQAEVVATMGDLWRGVAEMFPVGHAAQEGKATEDNTRWLVERFGDRLSAWLASQSAQASVFGGSSDVPPVATRQEPPSMDSRMHARREVPTAEPPELLVTPLPRTLAVNSRYAPLEGDRATVMLQTRARARQLYSAPTELMDFFAHSVAPAIARLEENRMATPEEMVDMLLGPLVGRRFSGTRLADCVGVSGLVAGLRGFLETQSKRGAGYYKTRGALAQWLQKLDGGEIACRQRIVFYYHELLSLGPAALQDSELFGMLANNLGGALAEYWRDRPDQARGRLLSRIQALATAAQLHAGREDRGKDETGMAGRLLGALGMSIEGEQAFDAARALRVVANIPSSWREVDEKILAGGNGARHDEDWMALMSCAAALVRMGFNERDDWDDIPASLFNAGVALARERKSTIGSKQAIVVAQIALNATGFIWALARGKDWADALTAFHGLDCAVNLFGSLTEWEPADGRNEAKSVMRRLAEGLLAAGADLERRQQAEFERLGASWKELGIEASAVRRSQQVLLKDMDDLLKALAINLPNHAGLGAGDGNANREWMVGAATTLAGRLKAAFGEAKHGELAADLQTLLLSLVRLSADLEPAWQTLYADMAEPTLDRSDTAEGPRDHSGPLVKLGEMSRADWLALAGKAIDPELAAAADPNDTVKPRLGPWLQEYLLASH